MLAAIAARTRRIRLASAVTVLSTLDPVRVYEDFATLEALVDWGGLPADLVEESVHRVAAEVLPRLSAQDKASGAPAPNASTAGAG